MTDKSIENILSRVNDDDIPLEVRHTPDKGRGSLLWILLRRETFFWNIVVNSSQKKKV